MPDQDPNELHGQRAGGRDQQQGEGLASDDNAEPAEPTEAQKESLDRQTRDREPKN